MDTENTLSELVLNDTVTIHVMPRHFSWNGMKLMVNGSEMLQSLKAQS